MNNMGETDSLTYLTFTLDGEVFAVDVSKVREVLDYTRITRVPKTPVYMKGVINLRGSVIPVVDMRLKFELESTEPTVDTCIVILEFDFEGEQTMIGAITDSVEEVFELEGENIQPPPGMGNKFSSEFISGMGRHSDGFIMILDIEKVFSADVLMELQGLPDTGPLAQGMVQEGATDGGYIQTDGKTVQEVTDP